MSERKHRIVTRQQYEDGYRVFHGIDVIPNVTTHQYEYVRTIGGARGDGSDDLIVVLEPEGRGQ